MLTNSNLNKDRLTDQKRKRQLSQHLLLIQGALLLLLQPAFVWWSSALYASLLLWHGYRSYSGQHAVKPLIINLLALLMLVPILAAGRQLGVLHLMLHILLLAAILRLLLLQRLADIKQLFWVQYFLIACCFIFYQSISMALLVIAVFLLNLALQYRTFASAQSRLPVTSLLRATLLTLPIWLALFLLFPRIGPLWQIPSQQSAITGLGDSLDPGSIENLVQSDELAFRVNFQSERPKRQEWYWRAKVYEEFDGRRWQVHSRFNQRSSMAAASELTAEDRYQIIAEASHQRDLFSLGVPVSLSANISRRPAELVMANSVLSQRFSYQLSSSRTPPALAFAREAEMNLQLTNHNPRARAFAQELAASHAKPAQLVAAIADYFAN
uniref:DUF3488 domain-containing protein n=1 Tax=Arsukibacterium sp. TaxID=1977258 RepID=UPI002FD8FACD